MHDFLMHLHAQKSSASASDTRLLLKCFDGALVQNVVWLVRRFVAEINWFLYPQETCILLRQVHLKQLRTFARFFPKWVTVLVRLKTPGWKLQRRRPRSEALAPWPLRKSKTDAGMEEWLDRRGVRIRTVQSHVTSDEVCGSLKFHFTSNHVLRQMSRSPVDGGRSSQVHCAWVCLWYSPSEWTDDGRSPPG